MEMAPERRPVGNTFWDLSVYLRPEDRLMAWLETLAVALTLPGRVKPLRLALERPDRETALAWPPERLASEQVMRALAERIQRAGMQDLFGQILVPVEEVVEMRGGQKSISERKFFPGYVLVQIETDEEGGVPRIDDESWHLIKETPKVMGFIGGTRERPLPIKDSEADVILRRVQEGVDKPKPKVLFLCNIKNSC